MPSAEPIILLVLLSTILIAFYFSDKISSSPDEKKEGFFSSSTDAKKPNLWFVLDDFELNSRNWSDFGGRLYKDPNVGFITLTKARCNISQGQDFTVNEVLGRKEVAHIIRTNKGLIPENHLAIPSFLWKAWARAALLANAGGLYFEGTSLCLGPSFKPLVDGRDAMTFGLEHDERYAHTPGPYTGWATAPGHKSWVGLADTLGQFIDAGPLVWNSVRARNEIIKLNNDYLTSDMQTVKTAEWCRRVDGRPIENEDLFGRSLTVGWTPGPEVVYVPLDYERLERDKNFSWFLRMNPEQLLNTENSFLWAQLLAKAV